MSLLSHVVQSSNDVSSDYLSVNKNNTVYSKVLGLESSTNSSSHSTTVTNVTEEASFDYISYNEERPKLTTTSTNLTVFNSACASTDTTKRYQTKMLLASLIEHFCKAYGDKPDANRKVFFLICQTLRSLGIIDAEFVDEMTSVRSSFQQAFHKLFFTAVQTVRNQDLLQFDDNLPRLIKQKDESDYFTNSPNTSSPNESSYSSCTSSSQTSAIDNTPKKKTTTKEKDYFSSSSLNIDIASLSLNSPPISSKLSSSSNTLHSFVHGDNIFQNLSVQNSRYNNDFIELNLLGKGGFASAFRARNKLDGIDYAVKKIRLGNDIEDESDRHKENPYEKIFREIKNLARLEHVNVIRYYASWLEYDTSNNDDHSDESDWEVDSTRIKSNQTDESSIFNGNDPTFDSDEDLSSINNYHYYPSESGMSQIQFGDDSGGYEAGKNDSSSVSTRPSSISNKTSSESIPQQTGWTLFIQMQLCATTLHDYIRYRNKKCAEDESYDSSQQVDTDRNIEIFSQILHGTAYIHDQGLIHRDLKPSNIFLSMAFNPQEGRRKRAHSAGGSLESSGYLSSSAATNTTTNSSSYRSSYDDLVSENGLIKDNMWEESWVPKIGDFGLAAEALEEGENGDAILIPTPMSSTPPSPKFPDLSSTATTATTTTSASYNTDDNIDTIHLDSTSTSHARPKRPKPRRTRTVGVGTRTYASPEQLAIPAQAYDEKVDIYSLGIILFELFQPFTTGMERADYLDKLKHGVFPEGFLEMYPKVSALIIWMMDERPGQRPSAHQLLQFELFNQPQEDIVDICATLQTKLQNKNSIIEELKKKVERVELEKRLAISEMQQRLDDMQRQLDNLQGNPIKNERPGLKKCILTQSPSVLKKKKEVRWSVTHTETC